MARTGIENPPRGTRKRGQPKKDGSPLTDTTRAEIVTRLAMYDSVSDIHTDLVERGINVTHQAVSHYNPSTGRLHKKWVKLFSETREQFHKEMMDEPIAQRAYRLRQLHRQYLKADKAGQIPLAAQILEQAAKEVGGIFTNVTKVKGQIDHQVEVGMNTDEMRNMLADRLKDAMLRARPVQPKALSDQSAKG